MRAVHGRSARVPRIPTFEADDRLKFTPEEQRAIQTAERASGYRVQQGSVIRPRPRRGLAFAIALALAYFLLSEFVVAVLHSFLSPESPHGNGAPVAETIQREPRSQQIPDSGALEFQNQASVSQLPETMPPPTSEHSADDPAGAPGQIAPAGPSGGLPTLVIGEEQMNMKNIFRRNLADEVQVPEIEVDGDKVRVPESEEPEEPGSREQGNPPEQGRRTREFRLPKTTWFAQSEEIESRSRKIITRFPFARRRTEMTRERWEAEIRVMRRVFPRFRPFAVPGSVAGFHGYFIGPRTRVPYIVVARSRIRDYPAKEPAVYMEPHAENHHWVSDNRLCYQREGHSWNPAQDTFAQALALAAKYIGEFDGT
jgi:hypothetical protein